LNCEEHNDELWWRSNSELVKKSDTIYEIATFFHNELADFLTKIGGKYANIDGKDEEIEDIFRWINKIEDECI
jgi:archaellum component FlaC